MEFLIMPQLGVALSSGANSAAYLSSGGSTWRCYPYIVGNEATPITQPDASQISPGQGSCAQRVGNPFARLRIKDNQKPRVRKNGAKHRKVRGRTRQLYLARSYDDQRLFAFNLYLALLAYGLIFAQARPQNPYAMSSFLSQNRKLRETYAELPF